MKYIKYREDKKHGTFDFPIEFYHVTASHPRYEMSYHWHIEYEIIRILKGEFLMTLNESTFTAQEGDLIFDKAERCTEEYRSTVSMNVLSLTSVFFYLLIISGKHF